MKKNFIKYLACALVAVMILGTTAFAATTTTTTYKGEYITVSTQVTGAAENEQVTYLVYQEADGVDGIADSEIIYINQKAATEGTATFDYKVVKGSPLPSGTKVIAGSTSGAALATPYDNIDPLSPNVVIDESASALTVDYDRYLGKGEEGTLSIAAFTGGTAYVNDVIYTGAVTVVGGQTYTVTFVADEEPEAPSVTDGTVESDLTAGEEAFVSRFGTISIPEDNTSVITYGIVFAVGNVADLTVETEGAVVYPALGNKDGEFAVKLVDGGQGVIVEGSEYTTRTYICVDGVYSYDD